MREGTVEKADGRIIFRYERQLPHPVERVWAAVTDPDEVEAWTGMAMQIDLRPGGKYVSHHSNGDTVIDQIVKVEPPTLLVHTWWAHVNPSALVTWKLTAEGDGCRLVLTHVLTIEDAQTAAAGIGMADQWPTMLARNGSGWHRLLDMLDAHLQGDKLEWSPEMQQQMQEHYAALLA
jgi:uncharacterized protein YndB with AHSA1/START domain